MQRTKVIVLRTLRYSDSQIVVSLFSEHFGFFSSMIRIARSSKSMGRNTLWQVLNILEVSIDYRPGKEFQKLSDVCIFTPWKDIPYHPQKAAVAIFLADFLTHSLKQEGENRSLFIFVENSLCWFDESSSSFSSFHLFFMLRLTRFIGILPGVAGYTKEAVYDLQSSCFTMVTPSHGQYLETADAVYLPLLLKTEYSQMHHHKLTQKQRWHMLEVILRYYQMHVPGFGELKSLMTLRELFS